MALSSVTFAFVAATVLHRFAPFPSANTERASEDAFAQGLYPREFLPPLMGPARWTTERASFRFRHLPSGPLGLEIRVVDHRAPVRVHAGRVSVGIVAKNQTAADFKLPGANRGRLDVDLLVEPFAARGGRRLGTLLQQVTVTHVRSLAPRPELALWFVVPALVSALAGVWVGLGRWAAALAAGVSSSELLLLWPQGLVRSGYTERLALLLTAGALVSLGFAKWIRPRRTDAAPWAFVSLMAAILVQGVMATHPLVFGFDAVFHANKLAAVARGEIFPVSLTQHARPFHFPYGFSFYALLSPLVWMRVDLGALVRSGAAASGVFASAALFWLLALEAPRRAALAVLLLQLLPWSFAVYSNANYSNVFGQVLTFLFFAWWAGGRPGGWLSGAALLAIGCLAHLSSAVGLVTLSGCLLVWNRANLGREGNRWIGVAIGLGLAAAYYLQFLGLIVPQLPRLLEGGGGTGEAVSLWRSLQTQLRAAVVECGVPVLVLALIGRPRAPVGLDRDLRAYWMAGGLLALFAVVSPLEVRYLYALTHPLAIAAAFGFETLYKGGHRLRAVGFVLLAAQLVVGGRTFVNVMLYDWRY